MIPLSREHHYALMLCLRIHRGTGTHGADINWLREQSRKTIQFFERDLVPHFQAEETALFPAMSAMKKATPLVSTLIGEHGEMRLRVESLRRLEKETEAAIVSKALIDFAALLEAHIRKEERKLFPIYEEEVSGAIDRTVGENILQQIGPALQPKHPELLE